MSYLLNTDKKPSAAVRFDTDTAAGLVAYRDNLKQITGVEVSISAAINSLMTETLRAKGFIK